MKSKSALFTVLTVMLAAMLILYQHGVNKRMEKEHELLNQPGTVEVKNGLIALPELDVVLPASDPTSDINGSASFSSTTASSDDTNPVKYMQTVENLSRLGVHCDDIALAAGQLYTDRVNGASIGYAYRWVSTLVDDTAPHAERILGELSSLADDLYANPPTYKKVMFSNILYACQHSQFGADE
jgi:hypothetical protein